MFNSKAASSVAHTETEEIVPDATDGRWRYIKKPGFHPRPLKVAITGAGFSGLCLAIKILKAQKEGKLGAVDFVLYEKDTDYGGTWHANRYPGCQCDVPSHIYQYTFAPYSDWPQFYSSSKEINNYLHIVAEKYGIEPFIRLRHTMRSAIFDEAEGKWNLTVEDGNGKISQSSVDVYVPATGVLSQVNRPNIPGLDLFTKNPVLHTAEFPADLDWKVAFKDERVAVIGNGSSGVQTVGAITPYCDSVSVFARSKFWISAPFMNDIVGERNWEHGNFTYSEEDKERFRRDPEAFFKHSSLLAAYNQHHFDLVMKGSEPQKLVKADLRAKMEESLGDPSLIEKFIPDWDVWCRRVTPCVPFIEAVKQPHVKVITEPIREITASGIVTASGELEEVDRIILATGFDTSFKPKYELRGKGGVSLADVWSTRAQAYMSLAVAGFPNLFYMCGPGTIFANGTLITGIESNADYIIEALFKLQKHDVKYMEISKEVQDEYMEQQEAVMADLVFTDACSSWYKNGRRDAYPDAIYAGSTLQFMELLSNPRWEDWTFAPRYRNRFSFLGNGVGTHEATDGNRAHYLRLEHYVDPLRATDRGS